MPHSSSMCSMWTLEIHAVLQSRTGSLVGPLYSCSRHEQLLYTHTHAHAHTRMLLCRQSSPNKRGSHEGQNVLLVAAAAAAAATNTASGNNRTSPFGPSAASAASRRSSEGGCGERRTPIMLDRAS
eukprot:scaffold184900_cov19-Tisochrysis_lutea.AAC.2